MSNEIEKLLEKIINALENIKEKTPLTHCITNFVTVNDCANGILAIGGSPIMADDSEEVKEIVEISDALVINIGKLSKDQIAAIIDSCKYANETNTPIVLDPVGAGVSSLRNNITLEIVKNYKISVIRGNMSEIKAITTLLKLPTLENYDTNQVKGVDVNVNDIITKDNLKDNSKIVKELSSHLNTVVIASGPLDIISNGKNTLIIENGNDMMPKITGSGCMLSSIVGTCVSVNDPFIGSILATLSMGIAGEEARKYVNKKDLGTGTFRAILIDYLYKINKDLLLNNSKFYEI